MASPRLRHESLCRLPVRGQTCLVLRQGLLTLILLGGLAGAALAGTTSTRIEVLLHGMDCSICSQGLERRLRNLPGAESVRLDLERGRLDLTLRPGSNLADDTLRSLMRDAGIVVRQIRRESRRP